MDSRLVTGLFGIIVVFSSMEINLVHSQQCNEPASLPEGLDYQGTKPTFPINDGIEVTFECATGYTLVGTNPAACTSGTLTLPTCTGCADPGSPSAPLKYKTTAPTYPIADEATVEFDCNDGYVIQGANPAVCTGNTLTLPTCVDDKCLDPGTLPTGLKYKTSAPTYPIDDGTTVEFECESGYELSGTNPATCTGVTLTLPECTASTCADPGTLTTGLKYKGDAPTYPIADKATVEFECDDGYTLDGTNPAVCTGGTLILPTCKADSGSGILAVSILTVMIPIITMLAPWQ